MHESLIAPLRDWQNFYQLTGEVAGTLIGLMFVAMSLGSRQDFTEEEKDGAAGKVRTFATPTILHLSAVVIIAAIMSIPIHNRLSLSLSLGIFGLLGVVQTGHNYGRIVQHHRVHPIDKSNWTWHFRMPFFCYSLVLITSFSLYSSFSTMSLMAVAIILFLAIGIRNSWTTTLLLSGIVRR